MIKAILFDFDGTLADTMNDNFLAWKKVFSDFGIEIKKEDYFILEGMKVLEIAEQLSKKYNQKINCENAVMSKNEYYLNNNSFSLYSEILEIINLLVKNGKKLAIVSASPREKLEKTLPKKFLEKFDVVICSEDYFNGKPHPEPYLNAMKKLNLNPEECIVIENAPLGIKSAKASGAYCIALTTTLDKEHLKEADIILTNHKELKENLENYISKD